MRLQEAGRRRMVDVLRQGKAWDAAADAYYCTAMATQVGEVTQASCTSECVARATAAPPAKRVVDWELDRGGVDVGGSKA